MLSMRSLGSVKKFDLELAQWQFKPQLLFSFTRPIKRIISYRNGYVLPI